MLGERHMLMKIAALAWQAWNLEFSRQAGTFHGTCTGSPYLQLLGGLGNVQGS